MDVASNVTAEVGFELFRAISATVVASNNVFVSAYSILSALSMLILATKGGSERELLSLLNVKKDGLDAYHHGFSDLIRTMASPSLSSANRLFIQQNFPVAESFLSDAERFYSSGAENVDFLSSPETNLAAMAKINDWVKKKTGGKIPKLLDSPLSSQTLAFLANAVHFKADWLQPFKPEYTRQATFRVSADETVQCDMMYLSDADGVRYSYSGRLRSNLIELPYEGNYSMLIILPFVGQSLSNVENKLTRSLFHAEMEKLRDRWPAPDIFLPKFKIEFETDLIRPLRSLGVNSIFVPGRANLTGMINSSAAGVINNEKIAVSKIVHKAVIEVDEKGAEAGAATGIGIMLVSMPPTFRMDHPFLFFVVHRPTKMPIFSGRLSKPFAAATAG